MPLHLVNPVADQLLPNLLNCASLGLPFAEEGVYAGKHAIITGSGPSLRKWTVIDRLRRLVRTGKYVVFGCKESIHVLREHKILVHHSVSIDPTPWQANDRKTPLIDGCHYLVATTCHPDLFQWLSGRRVSVFHSACGVHDPATGESEVDLYLRLFGHSIVTSGGYTVVNRAMVLARFMGCNRLVLAGCDFGSRKRSERYFAGAQGNAGNDTGPEITDDGLVDGKPWWCRHDQILSAADVALALKADTNIEMLGDSLAKSLARHSDDFIRAAAHRIST